MTEINYPDREELARELFVADNWRQSREGNLEDWAVLKPTYKSYAYTLADAALDMFRKANK